MGLCIYKILLNFEFEFVFLVLNCITWYFCMATESRYRYLWPDYNYFVTIALNCGSDSSSWCFSRWTGYNRTQLRSPREECKRWLWKLKWVINNGNKKLKWVRTFIRFNCKWSHLFLVSIRLRSGWKNTVQMNYFACDNLITWSENTIPTCLFGCFLL